MPTTQPTKATPPGPGVLLPRLTKVGDSASDGVASAMSKQQVSATPARCSLLDQECCTGACRLGLFCAGSSVHAEYDLAPDCTEALLRRCNGPMRSPCPVISFDKICQSQIRALKAHTCCQITSAGTWLYTKPLRFGVDISGRLSWHACCGSFPSALRNSSLNEPRVRKFCVSATSLLLLVATTASVSSITQRRRTLKLARLR